MPVLSHRKEEKQKAPWGNNTYILLLVLPWQKQFLKVCVCVSVCMSMCLSICLCVSVYVCMCVACIRRCLSRLRSPELILR